ncbi:unnamed protein product [Schistosoma spindalis]|nr:unnamed protein product [Schistosoma spindale]
MVLAVYSSRTVQIRFLNNETLVPVRTRGTCSYCLCRQDRIHEITSDYSGRSEGDEICPYCFCVFNSPTE